MALPGKNSRDYPVRVTKQGADLIDEEAKRLGIEKTEVFRMALTEYFKQRGHVIDFSPQRGGKRTRMTEKQTFERVMNRVTALGLPEPTVEFSLRHKTYDLAWPNQQAAVEISRHKRPTDKNDWFVGSIQPTMIDDEIDTVLMSLPFDKTKGK